MYVSCQHYARTLHKIKRNVMNTLSVQILSGFVKQ